MYGIHMKVDAVTRKYLAHKAVESKLGCRYIRSRLQVLLDDQMFDNPDQKEFQLSVEAAQDFRSRSVRSNQCTGFLRPVKVKTGS